MNADLRRRLIKKAIAILAEGSTLLAVSLDEFFEGNTDEESIGVNLLREEHIGLEGFRRVLSGVRDRPDVQGVFIELAEVPGSDDEEDADLWPTASVAFVVTSAPLEQVKEWVAPLLPRDVSEGWGTRPGTKVPVPGSQLRPGMRPVRVWLL